MRRVDATAQISRKTVGALAPESQVLLAADAVKRNNVIDGNVPLRVTELVKYGCEPLTILHANVSVNELLENEPSLTVDDWYALGFDATHFASEPQFLHQMVGAYGASDVRTSMIKSASDAVAVAGANAVFLGMTTNDLLDKCQHAPTEAHSVIMLHGKDQSVLYSTLYMTGLKRRDLTTLGFNALNLSTEYKLSVAQLKSLGYDMTL